MADPSYAEQAITPGSSPQGIPPAQIQIEKLLNSFMEQAYQEMARYRWAEER
jgi:hypothetical protein